MKFLIVALFAVSAAAAEKLFCTPNSLFEQNCNNCVCSEDGKSAACTDMVCPERQRTGKICEPGTQFHLDALSTCTCGKDGTAAVCTLGPQVQARSRRLTNDGEYCTPGATFSPDNCNSCVCSQDGRSAACTLRMCPVEQPKKVCEPNKPFKDYCNTCACSKDGLTAACTRMWCDENIWNPDGTMKVHQVQHEAKQLCEPRKTFKDYCNACTCSEDGLSAACTRMWCDRKIWNQDGSTKFAVKSAQAPVCIPNSHFKEQCNTCTCSADGLFKICTMMSCEALDSKAKDQICTPRSTFTPDGCNVCKCDEFGTDFACTFMMCR
ncbi:balbiani ring protein 3-like [Phymastichus coffea]|uniref:balbiani ring protein 3-like n=1 Tax=Phymastichus coffea TaxID=108790 RepID=UPI00273ABA9E|nr:balbiani ring protein 3-like [Phymastichus coffea]XP_058794947.1 balbiani ring protein 3-like [Phymastichus coffea]